ncbi:SPOR domain-containing protein [Gayadomonas joobiniege]|uniref:SPOR domain-containing protein n=1 Tax=Gayadomonas joobiniege TaxID=1234606 RepID=UPI0003789837|nr:SPOR domain-containing protein [Gayadomonas joobiniege]
MAKDYVKKGRPATRSNKRQPKATPPPRKPPYVLIVVVAVLVVMFAYILYSIKDQAEPDIKVKKEIEQEKPLPKMPKEKWDYVNELENKTIQVDVPERTDEPKRDYQMQCGSFRKLSQADTLKARIAFVGLESIVKRTEGSNGVWYRVVLGPYQSKRNAEKDRHKLQNAKINGCQIWFWT